MFRKGLMFMAALGLIGASVPSAQADLCFRYESGGGTLVARGGELPQPNECRTLPFFEVGGYEGAATGSICMDKNGGTVVFHYAYHSCLAPTYFETGTCRLGVQNGLPASGACRVTVNQTGQPNADTTPVLSSCSGMELEETLPIHCTR
jgi:hypothetical protein